MEEEHIFGIVRLSSQSSQRRRLTDLCLCLSCMTMTVIIGCWTPWSTLPLLSAVPMQYPASSKQNKYESSLTFCIYNATSLFFFSPCFAKALDMQKSYVYFRHQSFFLPPLLHFLYLKMDSFHYARQQRAVPAHAAHSKHTD